MKSKNLSQIWHTRGSARSLNGEIKLLCALLEEKTWTQNHVFTKLNLYYVACSISANRDPFNKKQSLCTSLSEWVSEWAIFTGYNSIPGLKLLAEVKLQILGKPWKHAHVIKYCGYMMQSLPHLLCWNLKIPHPGTYSRLTSPIIFILSFAYYYLISRNFRYSV